MIMTIHLPDFDTMAAFLEPGILYGLEKKPLLMHP